MAQLATIICTIFLFSYSIPASAFVPPELIIIQVRNDHQDIILNLKRTGQHLANTNLPIWIARKNREPELMYLLMHDIGEFTMYHDVEMSSAVVLFHKPRRLYGVIDTRFYIKALQLRYTGTKFYHTVGDRHIDRRTDKYFHDKFYDFPMINNMDRGYLDTFINKPTPFQQGPNQSPSFPNLNMFDMNSIVSPPFGPSYDYIPQPGASSLPNLNGNRGHLYTNPQPGASHRNHHDGRAMQQISDTLYPEILVFISNDVVRHFTKRDPDLKLLVTYYLIHFNAIDMLFAKLANEVLIYINIAGFVIEFDEFVFPLIRMPGEQPPKYVDGDETLNRFPEYIKKYDNIFVRDSFDFFYVSTHYQIKDDGVLCEGLAITVDNYNNRINAKAAYKASGVILERKPIHSNFVDSAHEIAHQMNVDHDPTTEGRFCDGQQCFAILQESGTYCRNCIRWSDQSINEFKAYASTNVERCFLLNTPRSLHPYDAPMKTLSPSRQCTCYGYQSHDSQTPLDEVMSNRCNHKLACTYENRAFNYAIPKPIDGTPCGLAKVCWREKCEYLQEPMFLELINGKK